MEVWHAGKPEEQTMHTQQPRESDHPKIDIKTPHNKSIFDHNT
jgi:hypothetical protein